MEELGPLCYPGLDRVEKKHRVAIIRAADKVAARMGWACDGSIGIRGTSGRPNIYRNVCDLRSRMLGRHRGDFPSYTIDELEQQVEAAIRGEGWLAGSVEAARRHARMSTLERDGLTDTDEYRQLEAEQQRCLDEIGASLRQAMARFEAASGEAAQ